ncbi:MAG: tRNA (adenosine(37)-N6)-threonylcarbamoyltransferase complex ATPase subunit type 1 TsaE [Rhodocyclaceae bacterium]|nr:tRNA (adenosine(37)-N6)-threonylcarbamoyltransferase complex ATPase subunit type 1 TsaE [Rhodocyclaceae bacterium]MBL0076781.1 tRNA (adenosine(37)-N6)-threonylcarbamoyltransferase complex ATPase subunit type 1 TsaE [Rhodocyclaceae bacterium]MBP6109983.1 tRNA (adenosine(37)-N6)-threonylcarbamoyltransferase complex ATPase subunit type 1 TsaE [Rhodocyclaceae bacterium]MBP6279964.1 tRNA (adenosine(37)-N6)-threonylcarbamoyltransferase complex ATPase subunit type 1 TsaE [Rhodocyclaceae bacterium]
MHDKHLTELAERRTLNLDSEAATQSLGAALSAQLTPGMVIWLEGDLGAGKTTLVRAMLKSAGETGSVKSPTYTLVEVHPISGLNFYHFDFYRFIAPEEYLDAGLDEYFDGNGICLVEWPDKAAPYIPAADLQISLSVDTDGNNVDDSKRIAQFVAHTARGKLCLKAIFPPTAAPHSSSPPPV